MAPRKSKQQRTSRRRTALAAFDAITIEGGLLQPDILVLVASGDASEQKEADYGLDPKERLRDVVQTKFTLAQSFHARFLGSDKGPAATRRFLTGLFAQVFEFADFGETETVTIGERSFPIGHQALGGRVPIVFAPPSALDEPLKPFGEAGRRQSAGQLLQEFLNASEASLWGLACDATRLRLCRDSAALTRPSWIEADLARLFDADAPRLADFAALWLLVHSSRFGKPGTPPTDCALERWREEGRKQGATAREHLREGVEAALLELGRGFLEHPDNAALKTELASGKLSRQDYLQALLRLVYRFIFVFTAEDRDVLHTPEPQGANSDTPSVSSRPERSGEPGPKVTREEVFSRADAHSLGSRLRGNDTEGGAETEREQWQRARSLYARGYSLAHLRERAAKRVARDRHGDGWEGVKIVFRALARGETRLALPALGGLFGANGARELGDCALSNARLYEAIFRLAFIRTAAGLERVNWRDMQTEELGSVYESLLELSPLLGGADGFGFIDARGNERKTTASYYTPDSLVQALLDETLDPLIAETVRDKTPDAAVEALLSLRILDPACGSGHFLLAAARRLAAKIVELRNPGAASPSEFRHAFREAARRCLYGVDRNPMAVDLAKVALWIETVEPGKPLTFLDAHIRCGDSLLGIYDLAALDKGIPDDAYKPLTGDDKPAAREWSKRNKAEREARAKGQFAFSEPPRSFRDAVLAMEAQGEEVLADVEAKAQAFRKLLAGPERYALEVACDLYMAAFLLPKRAPPGRHAGEAQSFIPTSRDVWDRLGGGRSLGQIEAHAVDAAKQARVFHWPLEFPQVFFPLTGKSTGFDLSLGNPPWERIKLQEKEFFASRAPEIANADNKAARQRLIDSLEEATAGSVEKKLFESFVIAKRVSEAASAFARVGKESSGRFPLTGTGDVNTFALFAELLDQLGERVGAVLPTGIATDATTAPFFASIVERNRLCALIDFENREHLFSAVYFRVRFLVLALGTRVSATRFWCLLTNPGQMADRRREFELSAKEIAAINPNTRTAPMFRARADSELTRSIYARVPVLIDESKGAAGNPWGIAFARLFDMSNDSGLFRTARQLEAAGARREGTDWQAPETAAEGDVAPVRHVPLYEAKMIDIYNCRYGDFASADEKEDTDYREIPHADDATLNDPNYEPTPRYWVPDGEVSARLAAKGWTRGWLMGWRDITNATNERTVISAAFPRAGVGNKIPLLLSASDAARASAFIATWSSLTFDYVARQKIGGTTLNYFYVEQFPMPAPSAFSGSHLTFIVPRVLELTYTSHSMRPFAEDLGYDGPPFAWDEERRALLRAELDAKIAKLYGLDRDQLRYILDPEEIMGKGYPSETFRVLKKNEIAKYGDYRTARLTLSAWDRLERGEI